MSTDKIDPNKNATELPPTEATPKDSKTELTEEELKKVSGGADPAEMWQQLMQQLTQGRG